MEHVYCAVWTESLYRMSLSLPNPAFL
jgi:hypothetical protein